MAYPTLPMEILQQNIKRMKKINRYDEYFMILTDSITQVNLKFDCTISFISIYSSNFLEGSTKNGKFSNPRTNRHD